MATICSTSSRLPKSRLARQSGNRLNVVCPVGQYQREICVPGGSTPLFLPMGVLADGPHAHHRPQLHPTRPSRKAPTPSCLEFCHRLRRTNAGPLRDVPPGGSREYVRANNRSCISSISQEFDTGTSVNLVGPPNRDLETASARGLASPAGTRCPCTLASTSHPGRCRCRGHIPRGR